ncbi:ABC transporter ATP-binding protein [Actinopolymorpha sp. B9G3]|uniref:ABC transporter ATP-binding protein n=1 Tax=Actinopolymorpha sp. B9G3 TaxID=3158970 RepID=UPI0032D91011
MLVRLFTYRPGLMFASVLTWTLSSCLPILTGLVQQAIFEELDPSASGHLEGRDLEGRDLEGRDLVLLFAALAVLAVSEPALGVLWYWVHTTFEGTVEALVRTNLFSWVLTTSGRRGTPASPVTLVGHLRDDVPGHTSLVNEWYRLSGEGAFVAIALVIMLGIDPLITVATFLPLAGVVGCTHWVRSRLPRLWGEAREATTAVTNFVGEAFEGVQAIRVAGAETAVVRRFAHLNDLRRKAEVRSLVAARRIDAITVATTIAGRGLVLLIGAGAMVAGRFTVGDFILFAFYLDWMLMLPRRIGRLLSQHRTSEKSLERLREVMGTTPVSTLVAHRAVHLSGPRSQPSPASVHVVEPTASRRGRTRSHSGGRLRDLVVTDLCYRHPETGRGISGVSLHLRAGALTVVTGPVGAGKSTLLGVMLGLREAQSGALFWNGMRIEDPATFMVPPRVAYKPQVPWLFSEPLLDTILLGLPPDAVDLEAALRRAAFERDVAELDRGLDTRVGSRGVRLSGGQVQRASAARMFVRTPDLCVIDDLSSALDEETEHLVWERMDGARAEDRSAAYLVVSHRAAVLGRADQIVVLEAGSVASVSHPDRR